jgi:hypothetical protein
MHVCSESLIILQGCNGLIAPWTSALRTGGLPLGILGPRSKSPAQAPEPADETACQNNPKTNSSSASQGRPQGHTSRSNDTCIIDVKRCRKPEAYKEVPVLRTVSLTQSRELKNSDLLHCRPRSHSAFGRPPSLFAGRPSRLYPPPAAPPPPGSSPR